MHDAVGGTAQLHSRWLVVKLTRVKRLVDFPAAKKQHHPEPELVVRVRRHHFVERVRNGLSDGSLYAVPV